MHERCHQVLTIKSVHYPTMSRNGVCKILPKQTKRLANFQKNFVIKFLSKDVSGITDTKENTSLLDCHTKYKLRTCATDQNHIFCIYTHVRTLLN